MDLFVSPLTPSLVLLLGLAFLGALRRVRVLWVRPAVGSLAIASSTIVLVWVFLVRQAAAVLWAWDPVGLPGGSWRLQMDGWTWLCSLLLLLVGLVSVLTAYHNRPTAAAGSVATTLGLLTAVSLVVLSGNLLTLAASWTVLEVVLYVCSLVQPNGNVHRSPLANGVSLLLVWSALAFSGPAAARQSIGSETSTITLLALVAAALLRSGVYPLHSWRFRQVERELGGGIRHQVLAPILGIWLLGRLHGTLASMFRADPVWAALGVLGMLAGGVAVWLSTSSQSRLLWLGVHRAGTVLVAAAGANVAGPAALAWSLVTMSICLPSVALGEQLLSESALPYLLVLAILSLLGIPGTPGFAQTMAQDSLLRLEPSTLPLGMLALIANSLVSAALLGALSRSWRQRDRGNQAWQRIALFIGAIAIGLPLLLLGVVPQLLAGLLGTDLGSGLTDSLATLVSRATTATWVEIMVPIAVGGLLAWKRDVLLVTWKSRWDTALEFVRLRWLGRGLAWVLGRGSSVLRNAGMVVEGEGYLGWLGACLLLGWLLWTL